MSGPAIVAVSGVGLLGATVIVSAALLLPILIADSRWATRRRWARINAERTKRCLCGAAATSIRGDGPARFGFCATHATVPLTHPWQQLPDGTYAPTSTP